MENKNYTYTKYKQLCWTCSKAYAGKGCPWADELKYPDGVVLDKNKFILECPLFEYDKAFQKYGIKTLNGKDIVDFFKPIAVEKFKISERTYFRYKQSVDLNLKNNSSKFKNFKEEYLKFKENL